MTTKKSNDAQMIAAYRANASARRARSILNSAQSNKGAHVEQGQDSGILTIRKPAKTKPVSSLGGPTKAFGRSSISIPEFGRSLKRSVR
jgi:hypothetical protein